MRRGIRTARPAPEPLSPSLIKKSVTTRGAGASARSVVRGSHESYRPNLSLVRPFAGYCPHIVCRKGAVSAQPSSSLAAADIRSALDAWYDKGYTVAMKTAVSVPNDLFVHAEHLASQALAAANSTLAHCASSSTDWRARQSRNNLMRRMPKSIRRSRPISQQPRNARCFCARLPATRADCAVGYIQSFENCDHGRGGDFLQHRPDSGPRHG